MDGISAIVDVLEHYGPGAHPSGSGQEVHGGGGGLSALHTGVAELDDFMGTANKLARERKAAARAISEHKKANPTASEKSISLINAFNAAHVKLAKHLDTYPSAAVRTFYRQAKGNPAALKKVVRLSKWVKAISDLSHRPWERA